MTKVFVAARSADRERLLDRVRDLGVVHLAPVDPDRAKPDDKTMTRIKEIERALQILSSVKPEGQAPQISPTDAAREVLDTQRRSAEHHNRLMALHHQLEQMTLWGDVQTKQFEQLREAGLEIRFFSVPSEIVGEIDAECVEVVGSLPGKRSLVAVVDRRGEPRLPEQATGVPWPAQDAPAIRAEASEIDAGLKQDARHLAEIARLAPEMQRRLRELRQQADYTVALRGAADDERLFAIQGWVPTEQAASLATELARAGLDAAVQAREPEPDENPPTLIRYPRWTRPIAGLFEILGTVPGYRELDVSPFFMIGLPLFAGMLIGDAVYGLVFLLLPLLFYRKMVAAAGVPKTHLLITIGAVTVLWGVLSANYLGITPDAIARTGGFVQDSGTNMLPGIEAMKASSGVWAWIGKLMIGLGPLWDADPEKARMTLIKLSFLIGCLHLVSARIQSAVALYPALIAWAQVGWSVFLLGMLGVIWQLFFGAAGGMVVPMWLVSGTLIVGALMVVIFTSPYSAWPKRIAVGIAASLLPALGTFSDTMSYIRLMAVGMATYYIASAFNGLGSDVAATATWIVGAPIVLFGHLLNIGLSVIAIFAHGVRLNMLEFSNNAGVQWSGYPYAAFTNAPMKE